jgi:hypothetical protein
MLTPTELGVVVVLAVLALAVLLRRRSSYQSHLQQLGVNRKPKRQLVVGTWTRDEVAQHSKEDDLWLIIQVRAVCCQQGIQAAAAATFVYARLWAACGSALESTAL